MLFKVKSVLSIEVTLTKKRWDLITVIKHPSMKSEEKEVEDTLIDAFEVRKSKSDPCVFLYYKKQNEHYICVVIKHLNGDGFVITAYKTNIIKEGELIWTK
ncbi:MAG: hypothetical protein CVT88_02145 [Candidatus Altiarchaeales archaeon HGW-Altiarchaeales-1]|nr:MAG: hypothetical protein CVT88_02145 [Candidatus Altiarchaeales archaeon HGW-Altiarchaeales-1]